ncbi:MAG: hypothetical protein ACRBCJ_07090 [Hyphomicrobiaceae bacterium]
MLEVAISQLAAVLVQANDAMQTGLALRPFDPMSIVKIALLNPVFWIVGFIMGMKADQPQKVLIAGFAAGLVGFGVVWLATFFGILPTKGIGGATGVFLIGVFIGMLSAVIGYGVARRKTQK